MVLTFRYKAVKRPDGTTVKTPSIPVLLSHKEKFETIALLDSGADISVISKDIADILGMNLDKEKGISYGLGGKVESIKSRVNITIEKGHEKYTIDIPLLVILSRYDFPVLLGREGFFNEFVISFHQAEEKVTLKKINRNQ